MWTLFVDCYARYGWKNGSDFVEWIDLVAALKLGGRIAGTAITNATIPDGDEYVIVPVMVITLEFPEPVEQDV